MHETDVTMMAAVLVGPADPEIVGLEARLRAAQLQVDVAALDALLVETLLFTGGLVHLMRPRYEPPQYR